MRLFSSAPPQKIGTDIGVDRKRGGLPISSHRRWLRVALLVIALVVFADYGLSLSLESGWLHRALTRRLEAAFGRPVEVSHYSFSLLEGPRLEADYITVAEDTRFGNEYFLRADRMAVGLLWSALLRGRIAFGPLSFTRPRLNLVRLPDGEWNLESWLPRPPEKSPAIPVPGRESLRLARIEVSDGRVNFKQGAEKLPVAFANVEGSVEQIAPGSWRISLEAQPFRAAVSVQQAGVLSLRGIVGGTSSRLRPAALELDWSDASLSDVLRLLRGRDYGVRGLFSLQLAAHATGPEWDFSARSQFGQLHRWDLPLRADDPAINLSVDARWMPEKSHFELSQAILETRHSSIHAAGMVGWTPGSAPAQTVAKNARLEIFSSGIGLSDALDWYRAFHGAVAAQLALNGTATMDLRLAGWPPRIESGVAAVQSATLGDGTQAGVHMGRASLVLSRNAVFLAPAILAIGADSGEFHVNGLAQRLPKWHWEWKLDGRAEEVRRIFSVASALGFNLPPGWLIDGPAQFHLQWQGAGMPGILHPQGTIVLDGLKIRPPFLNGEITRIAGTLNFSPGDIKIRLDSAAAFSAHWRGTLERSATQGEWQFALAADELSAEEMDRWLNPRRRETFLGRVLPFLVSPPRPQPIPAWFRGHGSVSFGEFALTPFRLNQFTADASIDGRRLYLSNALARFYGGRLKGSIALNLAAQPAYDVLAQFRGVNLSLFSARTLSMADLFGGLASGDLQISARGADRSALLHSLACRGNARVRNPVYKGIDLNASLRAGSRREGVTSFDGALADFSCASGRVSFSRLVLFNPGGAFLAAGDVDFNRRMNFHLRSLANGSARALDGTALRDPIPSKLLAKGPEDANPAGPPGEFQLTGTLKSPRFVRASSPAGTP